MKNRKSRIIMKDGHKILETARKIRKIEKSVKITLQTNAPMCSKTKRYLEKNVIAIDLIYQRTLLVHGPSQMDHRPPMEARASKKLIWFSKEP